MGASLQKLVQSIQQTYGDKGQQVIQAKSPAITDLLMSNKPSFNHVLSEAMAAVFSAASSDQFRVQKRLQSNDASVRQISDLSDELLAQAAPAGGVNQNAAMGNLPILNRVPIQIFLDKAVEALDNISQQEFRVNDLIDGFIEGRVNEDQVIIETAKFSLAMSMLTTIIQTSVQTFKEIQQIPV